MRYLFALFATLPIFLIASPVEEKFLSESHRQHTYPEENIPVIETDNLCKLGKLTALRFIEWILENPEGVIALPTGKTPELFIRYLKYYKKHWNEPNVQKTLKEYNIGGSSFPDTSRLKFVQLDEFYPLNPYHDHSFTTYVRKYYIDFFGISEENALTMEGLYGLTLQEHGIDAVFPGGNFADTTELQQRAIMEAEQFFREYERKVRGWGGIGFFLGGIGPDGHVAFNQKGSLHSSMTRLVPLRYEIAAASAQDLGGIEHSRGKLAATIGLSTICFKPDALVIIFAAGEQKANAVALAVESAPCLDCPATAFQKMENVRFYVTKSSAKDLKMRKMLDYEGKSFAEVPFSFFENTLCEISLKLNKPLFALKAEDLKETPSGEFVLKSFPSKFLRIKYKTHRSLRNKIRSGLASFEEKTVLHTEPHHDDILLSYHPLARSLLAQNRNYFCCLTSGFNSVSNDFMKDRLQKMLDEKTAVSSFFREKYSDLLKGKEEKIIAKKISIEYGIDNERDFWEEIQKLKTYFEGVTPGMKDPKIVQVLKGSVRESEEDRAWNSDGVDLSQIYHMRSHFYTADLFAPSPTIEYDAEPMKKLINELDPHILSVAFDPEGTGPSTHYKVLQVVTEALRIAEVRKDLSIWAYRNVWDRFSYGEANFFYPVSSEDLDSLHETFMNCYSTQKKASFPSFMHDGPFSELSIQIQKQQAEELKVLLGERFFKNHPDPRVRNASGFILLKTMGVNEFVKQSESLKKKIELER